MNEIASTEIDFATPTSTTAGPATGAPMGATAAPATVVPLNDAAALYEVLAARIRGTAVGWSDSALARLERALLERYGSIIGGRQPVRRLVRLAARSEAA